MKKKIKKETKDKFLIKIEMGGTVMKGEGADVLEALRSIPPPFKIMNKGVLTMTYGEKKLQRLFLPIRLRRLFYPTAQPLMAKQLAVGLKWHPTSP